MLFPKKTAEISAVFFVFWHFFSLYFPFFLL